MLCPHRRPEGPRGQLARGVALGVRAQPLLPGGGRRRAPLHCLRHRASRYDNLVALPRGILAWFQPHAVGERLLCPRRLHRRQALYPRVGRQRRLGRQRPLRRVLPARRGSERVHLHGHLRRLHHHAQRDALKEDRHALHRHRARRCGRRLPQPRGGLRAQRH